MSFRSFEVISKAPMQRDGQLVGAVPPRESDVTILVVDDQECFRDALRELIGFTRGFALIGEACSGEEGTRAVARLSPQLVLIDVVMPGMGGIAAARTILSRRPAPAVVLISVDDRSRHPGAVSLGGTVAYVRKQDLGPSRLRELWERRGSLN